MNRSIEKTQQTPSPQSPQFDLAYCVFGVVLIVAGILLTFWWVAGDRTQPTFLGGGDAWQYYGPALHFLDHRIHAGEFPLWNPLVFCGQPHAANPQSFAFYPPNLIRSLLTFDPTPMKTHVGITFLVFGHMLLGGVATFFLARAHRLSFAGSLVASFAFSLSAPAVTRGCGHWIFHNVATWLPLLLLCLHSALTRVEWRYKVSFALAAGAAWGMAILGGVPNLVLVVAAATAAYYVLFRVMHPLTGLESAPIRDDPTERKGKGKKGKKGKKAKKDKKAKSAAQRRAFAGMVGRLALWDGVVLALLVVTGLLVACPLLLPGMAFADRSARVDKDEEAVEEFAPLAPGWELVKALAIYQGHGHYEGIRGAGAGVLFLALLGVFARPRRHAVLFGTLFLILLDCSLSEPVLFGRLLASAAPYNYSNPGRTMILTCLPMGLLAGLGVDAAFRPIGKLRWRIVRSVAIGLAGAAVVLIVALASRPEPVLPVGSMAVLFPAVLCLGTILGGWLGEPLVLGTVLSMLVLGETLTWNKYLVPSLVPETQQYPGPMDELEGPRTFWENNRRCTDETPNIRLYQLEGIMNGYDPLHMRDVREVLCYTPGEYTAFRRMVAAAEVTSRSSFGNLFLKRQFWLARQYVDGPLPKRNTVFPAATTAFLDSPGTLRIPRVAEKDLAGTAFSEDVTRLVLRAPSAPPLVLDSEQVAKTDAGLHVREFSAPPLHSTLVLLASSTCQAQLIPAFVDERAGRREFGCRLSLQPTNGKYRRFEIPMPDYTQMQILLAPDFGGRSGTIRVAGIEVVSDQADEGDLVRVVSRGANAVEVEVAQLPGPRLLLCVDAFYPGWRAYVDGAPTRIYRANNAFKAVVVPQGTHRVRFEFRSWRVVAGLSLSALAWAAILCGGLLALRHWRKPHQAHVVPGDN